MGSEAENQTPLLDFSGEVLENSAGGERWRDMCSRVREALETDGYFVMLLHDDDDDKIIIPKSLQEDMIKGMETLFDLPEETKSKHVDPRPYRSYLGNSPSESFGIDINEPLLDAEQAFTNLMWPEGNPSFCETLKSVSSRMLELNYKILRMIFESYGTVKLFDSHKRDRTTSVFRLMKYKLPPPGNEAAAGIIGLVPHSDKNDLTILCQNDVQGLEVLNRDGVFVPLTVPDNGFVVIAGDSLKAWSNARIKAAKHRVMMMSGNKERYSFGVFSMAKDGVSIEVPNELVDDDQHPLLYRPFKFSEFVAFFMDNITDDALEIYAGISPN